MDFPGSTDILNSEVFLSLSLSVCFSLSLPLSPCVSFLLKMLTFASSSCQVNHQIYLITNTSCYSTLFCAETYITANQFISMYDSMRMRKVERERESGKEQGEKNTLDLINSSFFYCMSSMNQIKISFHFYLSISLSLFLSISSFLSFSPFLCFSLSLCE